MKYIESLIQRFRREQGIYRDGRYFHPDGTPTGKLLVIAQRLEQQIPLLHFRVEGYYVVGSNRTGRNRRGYVDEESDLDILLLSSDYPIPRQAWSDLPKIRAAMNPDYTFEQVEGFYDGHKTQLEKRNLIDVIFDDSLQDIEEGVPVFDLKTYQWVQFHPRYNEINRENYRWKLAHWDN